MRYLLTTVCWILAFCWTIYSADLFPDIEDHKYRASIENLQERWIIKGYPDGTFGPEKEVTRAEMLKIVLKNIVENTDDQELTDCFPDVANERFAPYVCFAKQEGIVWWYPDGSFKPSKKVTIAEWFKIALETFTQSVKEWSGKNRFVPYLNYVHKWNLFSRYDLDPNEPMTRAQLSFLVDQLLLEQEGELSFEERIENLSVWCDESSLPPQPPTNVQVRDVQRSFISAVWDKVRAQRPTKLIVAFHGRTSPNTQVRQYYDLEKVRDEDVIIIYPAGLPEAWPSRNRRATNDPSDELRWFEFFDEILEEIWKEYCVDLDQVYAVGHSLWAWFANSLACARGDVVRAIGTVGWSTTANECTWSTAALIMHNPNDRLAAFSWWVVARDQLLDQNECGPETKAVGPAQGNCVEYINCSAWDPVIWCPHTQDYTTRNRSYYPHTWPDFAGEMIREFFEEHN